MTTSTLGQMVRRTVDRWSREALIFCAAHGRSGGAFEVNVWANGRTMVEVPGGICNQAITLEDFDTLKANDWFIYV